MLIVVHVEHKHTPILTFVVADNIEWDERVVLPKTDIGAAKNKKKKKLASAQTSKLCYLPWPPKDTQPIRLSQNTYISLPVQVLRYKVWSWCSTGALMMRGFFAIAAPDVTVFLAAASGEASTSLDSFASTVVGSGF